MLLAVIGVYGAVDCTVNLRKREIGVRLALGASPQGVVLLVMRQGAMPVVFGLLTGLVLAFALSRLVRAMLLGMNPLDPVTYLGMIGLLGLAALIAMYRPARRAARMDPSVTLRAE